MEITKVWNKEEIKGLLEISPKMITRSIVKLYERQTQDEQTSENTQHHNGVGFNGTDAPIMSSFAKQILKGKTLSEKQMAIAKKKIMKYSNQLSKIANGVL